jgi:hypothetical protein
LSAEHAGGGHWTEKTQAESEGIYTLFLEIVGDRDTRELDYKTAADYREALTRFPSNANKKREYRGGPKRIMKEYYTEFGRRNNLACI